MNRKRARPNWFRIILLSLLVLGGAYVNRFIISTQPSPFVSTPTPTRAPESFITEAEALFQDGKLIQAMDAYKEAIASRPGDPSTHIALARVQVFAGLYKEAQTSSEDALLLNNNNSMAHAMRAWTLDFQGDYLGAQASIKRALELDDKNALAHAYYVEILVDSYYNGTGEVGAIEKAITESNVALALAPDKLETHRARGYILEATGNYEKAIGEYKIAVGINKNIPDLHLALGRNYRTLGIYDQAVAEFQLADALNPEDPTPDLFISRTYATIGEYSKALQFADTAMSKKPGDANLRGNLGVMYYRNSYWPESIEQLGYLVNGGLTKEGNQITAVNLTSNDARVAEYYFTYGLALSRMNQCGEALKIAQTILSRIPSDELAVGNANEIINRCQQNLKVTPEPLPTATVTAPVPPTATPIPPTPTP